MAEVLLRDLGEGRFESRSAGSRPLGDVNPAAIRQLRLRGHDTRNLRSKSWDEFAGSDAERIDIVITVCDNAAGESCPMWHGSPLTAHWGIPDPAAVSGSDAAVAAAFETAYSTLREKIEAFVRIDFDKSNAGSLVDRLRQIGGR